MKFLGSTGDQLAIACDDRSINFLDTKRVLLLKRVNLKEDDGPPVELYATGNLLYALSHHGNVYCLDCRFILQSFFAFKPFLCFWISIS